VHGVVVVNDVSVNRQRDSVVSSTADKPDAARETSVYGSREASIDGDAVSVDVLQLYDPDGPIRAQCSGMNGATVQECSDAGYWLDLRVCSEKGGGAVCWDGGCVMCSPDASKCASNIVYTCTAGGQWPMKATLAEARPAGGAIASANARRTSSTVMEA
jgi:hypothetical protein